MTHIICPECHYIGKAAKRKRGSGRLEFSAWLAFPFGLPYTLWRMLSKIPVCRHCGSEFLIRVDSPVGKKLMAKLEEEALPSLTQDAEPSPRLMSVSPIAGSEPKSLPTHKDPDIW